MGPRWKSVRKERLIGRGKGYECIGRDRALNCGSVDGYDEECCE